MKSRLVIIECAGYFSGRYFCGDCNPLGTAAPKLWTFLLLLFTLLLSDFIIIRLNYYQTFIYFLFSKII